jgi:cytochrome c-type biogenesis protein CcmH/NrfF
VKRAAALLGVLAALAFAGTAVSSEQHPTLPEIEGEVLCTVCNEPLDMSSGPFADRERAVIRHWIAAGLTKSQIEDKLVQQFGRNVLLSPPTSGFNVIAWVLPIAGGIAAALVLAFGAWRWSRGRNAGEPPEQPPPVRIEPDLERRLDEELARYDA